MSGFVSTPETEFCGVCQRERVSCAHLDGEVATDGGEPVQESEPLEAVERVKDVHPNLLGLASAASTGDVENAEEHIAELRDALDDIEDLVLDGGRDA